jgi:feruloyl esterase
MKGLVRFGGLIAVALTLADLAQSDRELSAVGVGSTDACAALADRKVPATAIRVAEVIGAGSFTPPGRGSETITGLPAFCRVKGEIRPTADSNIGFELWLPLEHWNRKLAGAGNVGFGGVIQYDYRGTGASPAVSAAAVPLGYTMADQLKRGYATFATDTGHQNGDGGDDRASFGLGHGERVVDFGYRAVHESALKAKMLTVAYYGRPIDHAYWLGQSTGGRQGLMEAQRYPSDFDGIVTGAPPINVTWNWIRQVDGGLAVAKAVEQPLISAAALTLLHTAVIAACDQNDGLQDGLIDDPPTCRFDPAALLCGASQVPPACFTAAQVQAAQRIYEGLKDPITGIELNPGLEKGTESNWPAAFPRGAPHPAAVSYFRWLVAGNAAWDWTTFDFKRQSDYEFVRRSESRLAPILSALNPDLRAFKRRGGKILHFHGWSDERVESRTSTNYYKQVVRVTGGGSDRTALREVQAFYRLYMVSGMTHGLGHGPGPNMFDLLTALEGWVERGTVPDALVATHSAQGVIDRSRPICPFPATAVHAGAGNANDTARFVCRDTRASSTF